GFFQPIWVTQPPASPARERWSVVSGAARCLEQRRGFSDYRCRIDASTPSLLRLGTFYYPGWTLYVDGHRRPLPPVGPQGLIEFPIEPGVHDVSARFEDTPLRSWATRLSLASGMVLLALPLATAVIRHRQGDHRPPPWWQRPMTQPEGPAISTTAPEVNA